MEQKFRIYKSGYCLDIIKTKTILVRITKDNFCIYSTNSCRSKKEAMDEGLEKIKKFVEEGTVGNELLRNKRIE